MDHRAFIAQVPAEVLAELRTPSDGPGLRHLAGHVAIIAALALWVAQGWTLWWAALPALGIALVFLFTLEHEATHKTPFASERLNEQVGRAAGLIIFLPFEWFRYFHLAHHRHTNMPGRDPELATGHPTTWTGYIWHVSGMPYWFGTVRQLVANALGRDPGDFVPARARPRVVREARVMLGIYTLAGLSFVVSPLLLWIWLLPMLLGQPVLRLYLLAEHGRCPFVANMLENTRTTFTNRAVRFLAWNMPYHTEHHTLPTVPFHKLPALHARMREHLAVTSPGYAAFTAEYARGLEPGPLANDRAAG